MYENSISDACLIREIKIEDIFGLSWHLTLVKIEKSGQNWAFALFRLFHTFPAFINIFFGYFSNMFAYFLVYVSCISQDWLFAYFTLYQLFRVLLSIGQEA